ncbi:hypothetical protein HanPSC8_Chr01g0044281 [Helianthus annuus]|nr:hypothetical protein HanPSC8_Chr01g0044281 [Helianthus annuus]
MDPDPYHVGPPLVPFLHLNNPSILKIEAMYIKIHQFYSLLCLTESTKRCRINLNSTYKEVTYLPTVGCCSCNFTGNY